ncbi:hypothetical protein GOV14_01085 [Candidatus Pacearchaeota archaeon]|nr:hypothetical protein [Candidatus Pacearchaeota archaeon]
MKQKINRKNQHLFLSKTQIAVIIVLIFLVFSLINLNKYGETTDEHFSVYRGLIAFAYLEEFFFEHDSGIFHLTRNSGGVLEHPTFYPMLLVTSSTIFQERFGLNYIESYHLLNLLVFTLGLIFLFKLVSEMFSKKIGVYALIFMTLFPRFIAHAHFNSKDVPLMSFLIISMYFAYHAVKYKSLKSTFFAGLLFAISVSTKLDALNLILVFLFSWILFVLLTKQYKDKKVLKKHFLMLLVFAASFLIFVYAFWVLLWKNPFWIFKSIGFFLGDFINVAVLFFGKIHGSNHMVWYYYPVYIFLVTPILTFLFFLTGIFTSFKKKFLKAKLFEIILLSGWLFIPLLVRVIFNVNSYNGIRHIFFIIPSLIIFSALGFNFFLYFIKNKFFKYSKKIFYVVFALLVFWLVLESLMIHPHQGSYFNEPTRLLTPGDLGENFHLDYWGQSYIFGVEWLNNNVDEMSRVCLLTFSNLFKNYDLSPKIVRSCNNPDYLMLLTAYEGNYDYVNLSEYDLEYAVSVYDSDLSRIYKRKR